MTLTTIPLDFDDTAFMTSAASPSGYTVKVAYNAAIGGIFGASGLSLYKEGGGLRNRAPGEVVQDLLVQALNKPQFESAPCLKGELISNARSYLHRNGSRLSELLHENRKSSLVLNDENEVSVFAELLSLRKLEILLREVSQQWPLPANGFIETYTKCSQQGVQFVFISSGHDIFINRVFEVWGLPLPHIISDDTMRALPEYICKPDPRMMDHAMDLAKGTPTVYIGDDPNKDGKFADNCHLSFWLFDQSVEVLSSTESGLIFSDWRSLPI